MRAITHNHMNNVHRLNRLLARTYRSIYFPPFVICIAILVATGFGWQAARTSLENDVQTAASIRISDTEQALQSHLASYEKILRGGVGLFQGSDEVTRDDWKSYLGAFDAKSNYPGVQGIGFAKVVSDSQVAELTEYAHNQGIDSFQILPTTPARADHAAVIYVETIASQRTPTYGFDMYSEANRRDAMYEARDTNQATITGRLELASTDDTIPPIGFNMYTPYYGPSAPATVAERQASIQGYVYASFRADVFFRTITPGGDNPTMGFLITTKGDDDKHPLYQSDHFAAIKHQPGVKLLNHAFTRYGQTWNILYAVDRYSLVSDVQLKRPGGVLFFGVFAALLITTIILLVLRGRSRQLLAQKERAVELAKDELLSLASHQLRTPATGVKQYVGMVLQGFAGKVPKEQKELLEKAYNSNDRQLRIINEILHLAKIDAGRIILARQDTDLNQLVRDIVSEQQPDIKTAQHKVIQQLPSTITTIYADPHMLRMAVENLLSNAIKYTHPGGKITIKVTQDRRNVYVAVTDTGIGIEPSDMPKIFQQFSRLDTEMSQQVSGTGIGLYLAKHLVELHGGAITVVSTPGEGSTFTIRLPRSPKVP